MPIIACGLNHKTAPVALREKVVFESDKLALYLADLIRDENIREAVLLSTCNRSELYCDSEDEGKIQDWFCRQHQVSLEQLQSAWYCHRDQAAIEHVMNVACGLDSMILGEPQILGQMKEAFSEACAAGSVGPKFNRLFQHVFGVAKEVRTNTAIGACPVSISSAAVNLAKHVFPSSLSDAVILAIGAGDTIQLVLRHLQAYDVKSLILANRHIENVMPLAHKVGAKVVSFDELPVALSQADIVISATASASPIVLKKMFKQNNKPIFIIDIAVPRDVETDVAMLPYVRLFSIDDLKNIIQHNLQGREHAAQKAQEVINQRSQDFMVWLQALDQVAETIRSYRKQVKDLCDAELLKAMKQLQRGEDPAQVLMNFAHLFTNKLLHNPSVQLRQAGEEGRFELLQLAQQLFATPEPSTGLI